MAVSVPGYRLTGPVGEGVSARVFVGRPAVGTDEVAIRVGRLPLAGPAAAQRFTRELTAARSIAAHPHVVAVRDGGQTADRYPFVVLDLYRGGSLAAQVAAGMVLPAAAVLDLGFAMADVLVAAHDVGLCHGDLTPAAILIAPDGSPVLAGFELGTSWADVAEQHAGTAEAFDSGPVSAPPLNRFGCAAPELVRAARSGQVVEFTVAGDIYSLGATLHALLTGRARQLTGGNHSADESTEAAGGGPAIGDPTPDDDPGDQPGGIPSDEPAHGDAGLSRAARAVLGRAVAADPQQRWATAGAFRDALAAARAGRPIPVGRARPIPTHGRTPSPVSAGPSGPGAGPGHPPPGPPRSGNPVDSRGRPRQAVLVLVAVVSVAVLAAVIVVIIVMTAGRGG